MNDVLAVEAVGVTKTFGAITAVDDITVRVAPGEVYGVLGPNGAGKTTFLRMLFGLIRADSGTIRVFGKTWDEAGVGVLDGVAGFIDTSWWVGLTERRDGRHGDAGRRHRRLRRGRRSGSAPAAGRERRRCR